MPLSHTSNNCTLPCRRSSMSFANIVAMQPILLAWSDFTHACRIQGRSLRALAAVRLGRSAGDHRHLRGGWFWLCLVCSFDWLRSPQLQQPTPTTTRTHLCTHKPTHPHTYTTTANTKSRAPARPRMDVHSDERTGVHNYTPTLTPLHPCAKGRYALQFQQKNEYAYDDDGDY